MDNLIHKRSVSFASVIVDSMGNAKPPNKLVETKKVGKSNSFRTDVNNVVSEGPVHPIVSREDHCIADDTADWKIRFSDKVLEEEAGEDFHILQRVTSPTEAAPKRKREILTTDKECETLRTVKRQKTTTLHFIAPIEQAQNSFVCKVYLVDQKNLVNRWRRIVVPSSTYWQAVVDVLVDSFSIEHSSTFYAKRHFSEKCVFKGGAAKKYVKHAMLVSVSELNLEVGDGLDIFYGASKLNLRVEYLRDAASLKYDIERANMAEGQTPVNNEGVYIVGANSADSVLLF